MLTVGYCSFLHPIHNIDAATYRSFEHYNEYQDIPCIYFPVSGELLSLFFGFQRMVLQNLQKIIGYTLEQKLPLECLWLTRWSPFVCIDSICSQFKSPLTIISITAALFFVHLRALSFITPIMSILVFF